MRPIAVLSVLLVFIAPWPRAFALENFGLCHCRVTAGSRTVVDRKSGLVAFDCVSGAKFCQARCALLGGAKAIFSWRTTDPAKLEAFVADYLGPFGSVRTLGDKLLFRLGANPILRWDEMVDFARGMPSRFSGPIFIHARYECGPQDPDGGFQREIVETYDDLIPETMLDPKMDPGPSRLDRFLETLDTGAGVVIAIVGGTILVLSGAAFTPVMQGTPATLVPVLPGSPDAIPPG